MGSEVKGIEERIGEKEMGSEVKGIRDRRKDRGEGNGK